MVEKIEPVLPYQNTCDDEAHDWRNPKSSEQKGGKQNDGQHHRENPRGIGDECSRRNGLKGTEEHHFGHFWV